MSLSQADIQFLMSDAGHDILSEYAMADVSDKNTLPLITTLRKTLNAEQAGAILSTLRLRQKAVDKYPHYADQLLFTDDSLQQASDYSIRQYRAQQVKGESVLDVCCSIGSDTLAYAQAGFVAQGLDIDPVRIMIAQHNADVMGLSVQFDVADVMQPIPQAHDFIFFDPARRTAEGNRIFNVEQYIPPLSLVDTFKANEIAVKLSPAVDLKQLESYGGQVEFISVSGDLKEAVLWLNRKSQNPLATLLIGDDSHYLVADDHISVELAEPRAWLFEPDASILRSGAVQHLASLLDATLLDETIAYLTMDERVDTVWGRYWQILDWMPFNLKKLRRYLVEHHVGRVTVKKRGFPMSPEEVIQKLKLKKGAESRVLVMTRYNGNPIVLICNEI